MTDPKTLQYWIDTILNEAEERLTDWERNFLESIQSQLNLRGSLSNRQIDVLERIYSEKTS